MSGAGPEPPSRESYNGLRRVTLDLDDAEPFHLLRAWFNLEDAGAREIEARVSASGEGLHVRAWFTTEQVDDMAIETLRRWLGDDPRRIRLDRMHKKKPAQVLFSRKPDGSEAGDWRATPWRAIDDLRRESARFSR